LPRQRPSSEPPDEPGRVDDVTSTIPSDFFHNALHELRTMSLEKVPRGARRAVSVGASGRWYFDWFERCVGALDAHVGVEAFELRPEDLPRHVEWVESTADRFEGVPDERADLVFAGQTTEHLWATELVGFLLEAARVLAPGGRLVLDSPNRLVTEHLRWSHGGHTIELSSAEMEELLAYAGFDVDVRRGLWRCRFGSAVLQLEEELSRPKVLVRRVAETEPDDAFVWWLEATRAAREPDSASLSRRVEALFDEHWPTRVSRGLWPGPGVDTAVPSACGPLAAAAHAARWPMERCRTSHDRDRRSGWFGRPSGRA
jgi:SAM-dependent methyltransferase